ncbi:tetratricopeptide repeat protein [Streptomyces sp. NPDC002888]|uniref:tetratricopeptide repeat protein n=1 Tax=Streptomyces sp. NPDC002888 TaxID=3364668 RepID=UPI0036A3CBD4
MSRLSREKKREEQRAVPTAAPVTAPLDVRVPGDGPGAGGASIGGVPVDPAPGQEIQRAVLAHLHRIALATGHPVLAHIHDERIGYVVPLRMDPDGSTHFTADPTQMPPAAEQRDTSRPTPQAPPAPPQPADAPAVDEARLGDSGLPFTPPAAPPAAPAPPTTPAAPAPPAAPASPLPSASSAPASGDAAPAPRRDEPTHLLRATPDPVKDATPTFPLRSLGGTETRSGARPEPATFPLRAVPESAERAATSRTADAPGAVSEEGAPISGTPAAPGTTPAERAAAPGAPAAPGTVSVPTGAFGPPPEMDVWPQPASPLEETMGPAPLADVPPKSAPSADVPPKSAPSVDVPPKPAPAPLIDVTAEPEPDPKPTPVRGFDAVAEAVLGDDPLTAPGDGSAPALLAEPVARINEAVRAGRTETAAHLAEQTVVEASGSLGPEHPEVLRLRELAAYIAYLAGDPLRSFHLSLDLARIRRRTRDAEGAYGNIQSAASAWRAVRNPVQGLSLGYDLIGLWTELVAEGGPAADDLGQLESARTRMGRLAERARDAGVR